MLKEEEEQGEMVPGARDQGYDGQRTAVSGEYGEVEQVCWIWRGTLRGICMTGMVHSISAPELRDSHRLAGQGRSCVIEC